MAAEESRPDPTPPTSRAIMAEVEKHRENSARLLDNMATKLNEVVARGGRSAGGVMRFAAGNVHRAAYYVQSNSAREIFSGIERLIRRRPASSLAVAVVAGFLIGRALRSR